MVADGLPSGTVTFVFTDLVDSTRSWEERTEAMREVTAEHDDIVQDLVARHGGHIVKSMGDGVMAAFQDADGAVDTVVALQRRLLSTDWPVPVSARVGLHSGQAFPDAGGDYHGPTVNRAARVSGAAHGGQVLLSEATAALVGHATLDLGVHHLKGLPPLRLHQLVADGLTADFPPLPTATGPALPRPSTSFIGREDQVDQIGSLLRQQRLVTLLGPGGAGKTRLALAVAHGLRSAHPDGVFFVDLAAVGHDDAVAPAVCEALGLAADVSGDDERRVTEYLAVRRNLCVLDNCEHVLDGAASIAESVLATGGPATLLATTREALGVPGEHVIQVVPLDLETEALELFVARAHESGVVLDSEDPVVRASIMKLCERLDGLPLAIELAAARSTHLSPEQLVQRLDDRFRVLAGGRRRVARHQTLTATIDWSHDLLSPPEQQLLRMLAVFPASFSLEAVEALAGPDAVDGLGALVDKSLVQVVDDGSGRRYRLLDTVRLYASEKLVASGRGLAMHAAHRDLVHDGLESLPLEARWFGDEDVYAADRPSVRAALQWSSDTGDVEALAALATAFDWTRSSDWHDGLRWCGVASERLDELSTELQLRVAFMQSMLSTFGLDDAGRPYSARSVELAGTATTPLAAVIHAWRGLVLTVPATYERDDDLADECQRRADESTQIAAGATPPWRMYCELIAGMIQTTLAIIHPHRVGRAAEHFRRGLDAGEGLSGFEGLRSALREYLALHILVDGDPAAALDLIRQTPPGASFSPMFGPSQVAEILVLGALDRPEEAREALRAALTEARRVDLERGVEAVALCAGALAAVTEEWEQAARLLAVGARGINRGPENAFIYTWARTRTRAALGSDRSRALRDEGRAMSLDQALADLRG